MKKKPGSRRWWTRLLAIIYGICAVLCIPGYLAPWLRVEWIPVIQLLPVGLAWLIPIHAIAAIWFLVRGHKRTALFALTGLLLSIWVGSKDWKSSSDAPQEQADIRVASFNVQSFATNADKLTKIGKLIASQNVDVACFQEFKDFEMEGESSTAVETMAGLLNMPHYHFLHRPGYTQGVAVFSSFPIIKLDTLYLFEGEVNHGVLATLRHPKGHIGIGSMHFTSFRLFYQRSEKNQLKYLLPRLGRNATEGIATHQARIDLVLAKALEYPYPHILAGDLNTAPHTSIARQLRRHYTDSFLAGGQGLGWTYPLLGPLGVRIDHQYASKRWQVISHEVLKSGLSDHDATIASYVLE
ncbi:MAG: endonuclease/exonuclease/phosphatase family protein [Bacteroidia bacterium]